jgi:hypothetical protein
MNPGLRDAACWPEGPEGPAEGAPDSVDQHLLVVERGDKEAQHVDADNLGAGNALMASNSPDPHFVHNAQSVKSPRPAAKRGPFPQAAANRHVEFIQLGLDAAGQDERRRRRLADGPPRPGQVEPIEGRGTSILSALRQALGDHGLHARRRASRAWGRGCGAARASRGPAWRSVELTTQTFAELKANPSIGRAEALRRSMEALIKSGEPYEAHPATWAPFALVGEGDSSMPPSLPTQGVTSPATPRAPSKAPRAGRLEGR